MVTLYQVADTLRPWLGDDFLAGAPMVCVRARDMLCAFSPDRAALTDISQTLDSLLFCAVRDATAGRMTVRLKDGGFVRVQVADFSVMADDLMYLLFRSFPLDARHLMLLREYSVRQSSLSAIRALYTRYREYETPAELDALKRVAQSCHPAFRWRAWLI